MWPFCSHSDSLIRCAYKCLAALAAVCTARAFMHGQEIGAVAAGLVIVGMFLTAYLSNLPRVAPRLSADPATALPRVRRIPGFHEFIARRLGPPSRPLRFLWRFFLTPLGARSFADFWRFWNPVYGYVLLFFVYRPLRRRLPRPAAMYLTFLLSGFLLHDLPFSLSADLARGHVGFPAVTVLFAVFGAMALLSEALRLDFARFPWWLRAVSNLAWLAAAFGLYALVLMALGA